jgi:hypothetical protein
MTEEQLDALRHLIKQEIDAAQIDGMEHGVWGWADKHARRRMARLERLALSPPKFYTLLCLTLIG